MIDPNWSVVDLDPRTWRNLGKFLNLAQYFRAGQPGEHGLYVLHDGGRLLRVVDTERGVRRDLPIDDCRDPQELAGRLLRLEEWDRVHVVDKQHLARVAAKAQATPQRELTLDAYYRQVYHLLWDDPNGYVVMPPRPGDWRGWTYAQIKQFADQLPEAASVALGVIGGDALEIGLILEFRGGLIRRVSTFEALELAAPDIRLAPGFLDLLWSRLAEEFAPPAAVLVCSAAAFETWIGADDKAGSLRAARGAGQALYRLNLAGTGAQVTGD